MLQYISKRLADTFAASENTFAQRIKREDVMSDKVRDEQTDFLFKAILSLADLDECYAFFEDLCTVSEIREMAKRLTAARMLNKNYIYSDIAEQTGLSTATISRVNRCLKYGSNGYAAVIPRIEKRR
jgi:TrpR-related protein YerC/YecD